MHQQPRNGPIEVICLHDNEGPEVAGGAQSLVDYLQQIDGGYHAVCDNATTVTAASDETEVWGNGAINQRSLDVCMIHYAAADWTDDYSQNEMKQCAQWVAGKCQAYGIPPVWLNGAQLHQQGVKGLCTHWDLTLAGYVGTLGHTDPGPNFPRTEFLAEVNQILHPTPVYKVAPMFEPPLQIVAFLARPGGGIWLAGDEGLVLFVDTKDRVKVGGMISPADRTAFEGRHVAQLHLLAVGNFPRRWSYRIVDTAGEKYTPEKP